MVIPVIDIFAGPGGLGEGFSSLQTNSDIKFRIKLSVEKDAPAHQTLELRAFYRQFFPGQAPAAYYDYLAGVITREELFDKYRGEAASAVNEAWLAELGNRKFPDKLVDRRIKKALGQKRSKWVLIGGPPCQAYSLVGRSRIRGESKDKYEADHRHFLYKQYLRIIARHRPPVFVMENVKGLLSASVKEMQLFDSICSDLESPLAAIHGTRKATTMKSLNYRLIPIVAAPKTPEGDYAPDDFIVRMEKYGIPQARHRVIILGIRSDIHRNPRKLSLKNQVNIEDVINKLPRLRSGLSGQPDDAEMWKSAIASARKERWFMSQGVTTELRREISRQIRRVSAAFDRGAMFIARKPRRPRRHSNWYIDPRLDGICNHEARTHMKSDLHRYLFVAAYAKLNGRSPLLAEFPRELLPDHKNIGDAVMGSKFSDRFRAQRRGHPSTTITSHISKDGHYFIHYDPGQCRSLTVREAARLQTFPDNYYFEGTRTQQYHQVGNAVPPLLALQIARIVANLFD